MPARPVLRMGDPQLAEIAKPVTQFDTPQLHALIDDMLATMEAENGAGLAAPQIGEAWRVVVFGVDSNPRYPRAEPVPQTVLINPEITPIGDEQAEDWEGCLSVPGMRGWVPRYTRILYRGVDQLGNRIEREAEQFHARVVQHECDHLDGILYPQRIRDLRSLWLHRRASCKRATSRKLGRPQSASCRHPSGSFGSTVAVPSPTSSVATPTDSSMLPNGCRRIPNGTTMPPSTGSASYSASRDGSSIPSTLVSDIRMGTTVATNALLERQGEPTLFITTAGFGDALRIGYQNRPNLFDLAINLPPPLYDATIEVPARVSATGEVITPLDAAWATEQLTAAYDSGLRACAICLLHGYRYPEHERQLAEIAEDVGFTQVSISHTVSH